MRPDTLVTGLFSAVVGLGLAGRALLTPLPAPKTLAQRLVAIPARGIPVERPVTIHWNDNQIPFIEADSDRDAAVALGLVHAHLRLGQMEIYRRISQGRIAEMGGPIAADIDHALRIIGFGRAAAEMERTLPPATRAWLQGYADGINHYQWNVAELPLEFAVLGLAREKWTIRDVLTFSRMAGSDVNWLVWFNALGLRRRADWKEIWPRLVGNGGASLPSFGEKNDLAVLRELLSGLGKSGSNSLAIGAERTTTGAAIMANDPHLGITLPNPWMTIGLKSPSYHAVGLMAPGLPIFAIGRNPWIAWGGTNMRAASSEMYDLTALAPHAYTERYETIRIRWWPDRKITLRETVWGPVLSDAPMLKSLGGPEFALRWAGHRASDEIGAMLAVSRARDFGEFRRAFRGFSVPGQNMLFADNEGNIGQVMAVRLPAREDEPPADLISDRRAPDRAWREMVGVEDLPHSLNPESGFLASANNRPAASTVPIGYFFSPDDRVLRMNQIIETKSRLGVDDVKALQRDVFMPSSVVLRNFYLERLDALVPKATTGERVVTEQMREWNGHYHAESRGAVAFELFHATFVEKFYGATLGAGDGKLYAGMSGLATLLPGDIARADEAIVADALRHALGETARGIGKFPRWGDMHRLVMAHPLSFLPLTGGRYRFADHPTAGSSQTLMKTAHGSTRERHPTRYGSNARHISDMSDIDRNYFALLGGQDGWIRSENFLDQLATWREGEYVTMPLRIETVRRRFHRQTVLAP